MEISGLSATPGRLATGATMLGDVPHTRRARISPASPQATTAIPSAEAETFGRPVPAPALRPGSASRGGAASVHPPAPRA